MDWLISMIGAGISHILNTIGKFNLVKDDPRIKVLMQDEIVKLIIKDFCKIKLGKKYLYKFRNCFLQSTSLNYCFNDLICQFKLKRVNIDEETRDSTIKSPLSPHNK